MIENKQQAIERIKVVQEKLFRAGRISSRVDNSEQQLFPIAITVEESHALEKWIVSEKAQTSIEIGLAFAISSLAICRGLLSSEQIDSPRHLVIDPHQVNGFKSCGLQILEDAGIIELIDFHDEESQTLLPRLVSQQRSFDFAFVDGSHLFENVFLDLIFLGRLVKPGKAIFVDDYQLPAIKRAVSFCTSNLSWTMEELSPEDDLHQWAVLRTPAQAIVRNFRDYVEF